MCNSLDPTSSVTFLLSPYKLFLLVLKKNSSIHPQLPEVNFMTFQMKDFEVAHNSFQNFLAFPFLNAHPFLFVFIHSY